MADSAAKFTRIGRTIRGFTVEFHIYVLLEEAKTKVDGLMPYFDRLPNAHLKMLYPIFAINKKPASGPGGGTWQSGSVLTDVMGAKHQAKTGVADEDVRKYVVDKSKGMIGIPLDRWKQDAANLPYTVMHEVAHCVDFQLGGLVAKDATAADFAGMITDGKCGSPNPMTRRAIEAYARLICSPGRIHHTNNCPPGETSAIASKRLEAVLRRSPAFKSVPAEWRPSSKSPAY